MPHTPSEVAHDAAILAGKAGNLMSLLRLANTVAHLVAKGETCPAKVKWLWDPVPVIMGERHPPVAFCGPELVALYNDEEKQREVAAWLSRALARAYEGDWGKLDKHDTRANKDALESGARIMCVYPWLGEGPDNRDLWVMVEAAHGEDVRFRRVSVLHRSDY